MLEKVANCMLKHSLQSHHSLVSLNDIRILWKGHHNKVKTNVSEILLIRKHQPLLNIDEDSVPLDLFI